MSRSWWFAFALGLSAAGAQADPALVILVGDSTMAPQTGYGDALCQRLEPALACLNLGRGGRSTSSYRAEGLWDRAMARVRARAPGTAVHVLIQFGHNDQPGKPGRSTQLATEYPANLMRYVADVQAAGGVPVLVTPLTRRSFKGDQLVDDLQPWAEAMRDVAARQKVPLIDLHARSGAAVRPLGSATADELAMGIAGDATFDRTHVGEKGACVFAEMMSREMALAMDALATPRRPAVDCADVPAPTGKADAVHLNRATWDQPGWAVGTMGGRGGRIVRVTTLKAGGPGSLSAALGESGPRLVVFEVGGRIELDGASLELSNPFITIAGQTAPAPGISLINGRLNLRTHDVIVQHISLRAGAPVRSQRGGSGQGRGRGSITTRGGASQVIVDHCSFSVSTEEVLSISGPRFERPDLAAWERATSHEITYSNNLITQGVSDPHFAEGGNSGRGLIDDNVTGVLFLGNLYAGERDALFKGSDVLFTGGVNAALVNNLIVEPAARGLHDNLAGPEREDRAPAVGKLALVGNVLRHGPDAPPGAPLFSLGGQGDVELHLQDNIAIDANGDAAPLTGRNTAGAASMRQVSAPATPYLPPRLRVLPNDELEREILLSAGSRPWARDPVDIKALSGVPRGRSRLIHSADDSPEGAQDLPTARVFDETQWQLSDMSPKAGWGSLVRQPASR